MELTKEQKKIINSFKKYDRLKIFAYAGTGKTTTLKELSKAYRDMKFLYIAFNKSIVKEAKKKFCKNTDIKTVHALAYRNVIKDLNMKKIVQYKTIDIMKLYDISDYNAAWLILYAFNTFCHSSEKDINEKFVKTLIEVNPALINSIDKIKSPTLKKDIIHAIKYYANDLWNRMLYGKAKITHDFYLKYFQLNIDEYAKNFNYDAVLLDEAQDSNDVTLAIFDSINAKKRIMVGDIYQKIYGFRGSINGMEKWNADKILYLSVSFRFNENIAEKANDILKNIRNEKVLIKTANTNENKDNNSKDCEKIKTIAHIFRTNSALLDKAKQLIDEGTIFNTLRPIDEIVKLPLSILYFTRKEFNKVTEKWILNFNTIDELEKFAKTNNDIELLNAIKLVDKYREELFDIVDEIKNMNNLDSDVILTTAHTAKGLEWDYVIIHGDFPNLIKIMTENKITSLRKFKYLLKKNSKIALSISEEINLLYVAVTRAKKKLDYLTPNIEYFKLKPKEFDILLHGCGKEREKILEEIDERMKKNAKKFKKDMKDMSNEKLKNQNSCEFEGCSNIKNNKNNYNLDDLELREMTKKEIEELFAFFEE